MPGKVLDAAALQGVADAFHDRHKPTYGHDNRSEPVQLVSLRVTAIGAIPTLTISTSPAAPGDAANAIKAQRQVWFRGIGATQATIYDRRHMPAGLLAPGPAVIESLESTILVPPAWTARMDEHGFIHLTRGSQ